MKVFLDIDGVMVPANPWKTPVFLADGFPAFSAKAVQGLSKVLEATGAEVILTTSHKSAYTLEDWIAIFRTRGVATSKLSRLPENLTHLNRKDELLNWFSANNENENFVIIDDDKSLNALPPHLKARLVLTSGALGFNNELADEAIAILSSKIAEFI